MTVTVSAHDAGSGELERFILDADLGSPVAETLRNGVSITTTVVEV